jgi:ubiquinone/menaquinone biosynthesis C-methylase UbiE
VTIQAAATLAAARPCPQCAGTAVQTLHDGRFVLPVGHPLEPVVRVVACDRCGFCFNDTRSTREDYDRYYREISKYADPRLSSGSGSSTEDNRRLAETAGLIREFAGATGGSILDIGCGAGGLLDSLAALGFTALVGMDPAPACAAEVTRRGHRGVVGTLDDHPLGGDRAFDGIVLSHVLEHVRDVPAALVSVRRLLAADGWLYVEVPDAARYSECLIAPYQDFNLEHINHFSAGSLRNLLAAHGWSVACEATKTLDLGHGRGYPAVYAFARPAALADAEPDLTARHALAAYVTASARKMQAIEPILASELQAGPIVVWGVGQFTMRLLGETSLGGAAIAAFVDSNPIHHGRTLAGRPILAPAELHGHVTAATPIVIGSLVNLESIEAAIRGLGLANPVVRLRAAETA